MAALGGKRSFPNLGPSANFPVDEFGPRARFGGVITLLGATTLKADPDYFLLRASQEILAAETATHPAARAAHSQIAEHYLALASSIQAHGRRTRGAPQKHSRNHV
jgi:hypothetical protein